MTFDGKSEPDVEQMWCFVSLFFLPNGNIYSQTVVITLTEKPSRDSRTDLFSILIIQNYVPEQRLRY